jgi:hypothetical protein
MPKRMGEGLAGRMPYRRGGRKSMRTRHCNRRAAHGQALWEYAVPMALILISAGVMVTMTDIDKVIADYFMAASGHEASALSGGSFKMQVMGASASGATGNGGSGMTNFGKMQYADGTASGESAAGLMYALPVARSGARLPATSTEYLYP